MAAAAHAQNGGSRADSTPPTSNWLDGLAGTPKYDLDRLRTVLEILHIGDVDAHIQTLARGRRNTIAVRAVGFLLLLAIIAVMLLIAFARGRGQHQLAAWALIVVAVLIIAVVYLLAPFALVARLSVPGARRRCVTALLGAEVQKDQASAYAVTHQGWAARYLFQAVTQSRFSWARTPAATDRATGIAANLMAIDPYALSEEQGSKHRSFLRDASALVTISQEHRLKAPSLTIYPELPTRHTPPEDSMLLLDGTRISLRDAIYIDPMRTRTRWEVAKDFGLPSIAFVLSVISLVITLVRTR